MQSKSSNKSFEFFKNQIYDKKMKRCTKTMNHSCPATLKSTVLNRGRCYERNFQQIFPIFGEKKLAFSSKINDTIQFLLKLAVFGAKNAIICA
jgi:hypothetical protein